MKLISLSFISFTTLAQLCGTGLATLTGSCPGRIENWTAVCGEVSGVWDSTGSPFIACSTLTVPANDTLTIGPGVTVLFIWPMPFEIFGTLIAIGTEDDSIVFTGDTTDIWSRWYGLRLLGASDASALQYCVFENARWPSGETFDAGGGVHVLECNPQISHCLFRNNRSVRNGSGLSGYFSDLTITDCRFESNYAPYGGGAIFNFSTPTLIRCIFENNSAGQGGGVGFWWEGGSVINCTFVGNHGDDAGAIRGSSATPNVQNCIFVENTGFAAIALYQESNVPVIAHNCFWNNEGLLAISETALPPGIGDVTTMNANGDSCDTYFNLQLNPEFDPDSGDFALALGSPCIDAGDPLLPNDPDNTVSDIGAVPYLHDDFWSTIWFVNGFTMLGCPCEYPMPLLEGSQVRLRLDVTRNGASPEDPVVSSFNVSAGAGLPPWNGLWEPLPGGQISMDSFYVEVSAGVCCWRSGNLRFAFAHDTAIVEPSDWSCLNSESGCDGGVPILGTRDDKRAELRAAPNPFNSQTEIQFTLPGAQRVALTVFDLNGREVMRLADSHFDAGRHRVAFDGTKLASGVYFIRLISGTEIRTEKILLLK